MTDTLKDNVQRLLAQPGPGGSPPAPSLGSDLHVSGHATSKAKEIRDIYQRRITLQAKRTDGSPRFQNTDAALHALSTLKDDDPISVVTVTSPTGGAVLFADPTLSRLIAAMEISAPSLEFLHEYSDKRAQLEYERGVQDATHSKDQDESGKNTSADSTEPQGGTEWLQRSGYKTIDPTKGVIIGTVQPAGGFKYVGPPRKVGQTAWINVQNAIATLTDQERSVVTLRLFENLSSSQVATRLNIKLDDVHLIEEKLGLKIADAFSKIVVSPLREPDSGEKAF